MRKRLIALTLGVVGLLVGSASAQTYTLSPIPRVPFLDTANGDVPLANGKICTYIAGTSTPVFTFLDANGTQNANPVRTDANGMAAIYLATGSSYKYIVLSCANGACSDTTCSTGTVLYTQDGISAVPSGAANEEVPGTAGEALSAGQVVYLSDGSGGKQSGRWYKADAANTYSSTLSEVGMTPAAITSGNSGTIILGGQITGLSSLSVGAEYFVGTAGALTSTAPGNKRHLGHADSSTSLVLTGNPVTALPTMTNGQLIIGSTGASPVVAALTAGNGITATGGAGTLTVAAGAKSYTPTLVSASSTSEFDAIAWTVGAAEMADGDVILIEFAIQIRNSTGGAITPTIKFKWGATSITLTTSGWSNVAATRTLLLHLRCQRVGADLWVLDTNSGSTAALVNLNTDLIAVATTNTAQVMTAPTFSSSQTVKISVTLGSYNATNNFWNTLAARIVRVAAS